MCEIIDGLKEDIIKLEQLLIIIRKEKSNEIIKKEETIITPQTLD